MTPITSLVIFVIWSFCNPLCTYNYRDLDVVEVIQKVALDREEAALEEKTASESAQLLLDKNQMGGLVPRVAVLVEP